MLNIKTRQYLTYAALTLSVALVVSLTYQFLQQAQIQCFNGDQMFKEGRFDEAAEHYLNAIAGGLESPLVFHRLGDTYLARREFTKATPVFARLLQLDPTNLMVMLKLVELYALQNKTDNALALIETVLQRRPDWRPARVARAKVLTMVGRFDEAIIDYRLILHEHPEDTQ